MSSPTKLMELMSLSLCISHLSWPSSPGHHFSCLPGQLSSQITSSTTHGRRELCPPCSEESTLWEDTQLVRRDASLASSVKPLAQPSPLSLSPSQDQMDLEEQLNTTLIWLNASSAVSARKLAQLTPLLKDPTSSTQHFYMRSSFMIRRNSLRTETNGNHSSQESWKLRQELDDNISLTTQII